MSLKGMKNFAVGKSGETIVWRDAVEFNYFPLIELAHENSSDSISANIIKIVSPLDYGRYIVNEKIKLSVVVLSDIDFLPVTQICCSMLS